MLEENPALLATRGYIYRVLNFLEFLLWKRAGPENAPPCITMTMESLSSQQTASPKPSRRIFQPSELLQSFQTRNFNALCLSPPRQTDKGTYLNLSATTDGQTFSPFYVAFKDLKFVGQSSVPLDETRGSVKNEKGTYDPTFKFQKFTEDRTVQPLFEVLEKLQEYLFAIMEDKIKKGKIACLGHCTTHMPKEGVVLVKSLRIVPPKQTHIRTGPEAGAPIQNPMVRLQLSFPSPVRKRAATEFYDRTALTKGRNESYVYKPKTGDGKPVTAANLCKVLTSGTLSSGVLDVSSVVCSTFGISLPRWVLFFVLAPPLTRKPTIYDWIADMPDQFQQDLTNEGNNNDKEDEEGHEPLLWRPSNR